MYLGFFLFAALVYCGCGLVVCMMFYVATGLVDGASLIATAVMVYGLCGGDSCCVGLFNFDIWFGCRRLSSGLLGLAV